MYAELDKFKAVRVLESTWCFNRMSTSAADLRNHFKQYIDSDDGLIVSEVRAWASHATDGTPKDIE